MTLHEAGLTYRAVRLMARFAGWVLGRWPSLRRACATGVFPAVGVAGLHNMFENRERAKDEIAKAISTATCVRILSNKGDDWLGDKGILKEAILRKQASEDRFQVRTILLHLDSPWLTGQGLQFLGKSRAEVSRDFRDAHGRVSEWNAAHGLEPPKFHKQYPAWRFVQTDDFLFISTYVVQVGVDRAPILQFDSSSAIFKSVQRYFDFLHDWQAAPAGQFSVMERHIPKAISTETSAGIILLHGHGSEQRVLLIKKADGALALPKGHVHSDVAETLEAAAYRELEEETGLRRHPRPLRLVGAYASAHPLPEQLIVKSTIVFTRQADDAEASTELTTDAQWYTGRELLSCRFAYEYVGRAVTDAVNSVAHTPAIQPASVSLS